ncbi:hypothetical protein CB1_000288003 [Camelus ferus]|nr:hypothetical protein CB1_000288003 [Camelus ferus]
MAPGPASPESAAERAGKGKQTVPELLPRGVRSVGCPAKPPLCSQRVGKTHGVNAEGAAKNGGHWWKLPYWSLPFLAPEVGVEEVFRNSPEALRYASFPKPHPNSDFSGLRAKQAPPSTKFRLLEAGEALTRGLFIARARAERPGYRRYCLGLTSPSIRQGELAALSSALVSHVGRLTAGSAQVLPGPFC